MSDNCDNNDCSFDVNLQELSYEENNEKENNNEEMTIR